MFNLSHIRGEGFCFIGLKGKALADCRAENRNRYTHGCEN